MRLNILLRYFEDEKVEWSYSVIPQNINSIGEESDDMQ